MVRKGVNGEDTRFKTGSELSSSKEERNISPAIPGSEDGGEIDEDVEDSVRCLGVTGADQC
jgi:hypothetical protein